MTATRGDPELCVVGLSTMASSSQGTALGGRHAVEEGLERVL